MMNLSYDKDGNPIATERFNFPYGLEESSPLRISPEAVQKAIESLPMPQNELGKPRMHIDYEGDADNERQELSH